MLSQKYDILSEINFGSFLTKHMINFETGKDEKL